MSPLNKEASQENYYLVNDLESLEQLLEKLEQETKICIDTETTHLHPMLAQLVGIGFAIAGVAVISLS